MIIRTTIFAIAMSVSIGAATAAESVNVVVGRNASDLEKLAARELSGQFERLFDVATKSTNSIGDAKHVVLIGNPATNAAIKGVIKKWPELSDQGIVLRSFEQKDRSGVIVGGGSPVATLWAVYELGHRFGIRYLLRDDIFPDQQPLDLDGINVVMEPELRTRTWRTVNDFPVGPESWGLDDHQRVLGQLAKLKFNRVMLSVYPWQPFVHYEFRGVKKQTAMLWYGKQYQVDGDTPGKKIFRNAKFFENPDMASKKSYDELTSAGIKHLQGVIKSAQDLGMAVSLSIRPAEFTREFAEVLPGAEDVQQLEKATIGPGKQSFNDSVLKELVATKIRAYIETYPTIDTLVVGLPEFPHWDEHAEDAWKQLSQNGKLGGRTLDGLIETGRNRKLIASGERGVRAVKGNLAPLAFFKSLFSDSGMLTRPDGQKVNLVIRSIDPAFFPVLDQVVPEGASTLNFVDYTARRVVANRDLLARVPARKVRSQLILTLADDNVGVLSQSATTSVESLVNGIKRLGWDGFSTRYWLLGELTPTVYYLSRASWEADVTARSTHDDLFTTITGRQAVSDRMWLAHRHIESATNLIDQNDIGFAFPVENMVMKHYRAEPPPAWWDEMTEHYTQAMIEVYRCHDGADPRARKLTFYYGKRTQFVLDYLSCLKAVRAAAIAREKGETETAIEQLELAVESIYNGIDHLSDVARDNGERGLVAVLANYGYRPLLAELEKLSDE